MLENDLPECVYVRVPMEFYKPGEESFYSLGDKLDETFDFIHAHYGFGEVPESAVPKGVPIYIWSPESDRMKKEFSK